MPYENKFTLVVVGSFEGAIISFILSGVLCEYGFDGGWPSVFYIFGKGIVNFCWAWLITAVLCSNSK